MDPDWAAYIRLSAALGSRRGEATAVHHSALNLDDPSRATARIERVLTVGLQGPIEIEAPKSEAGFRTVSIGRNTALAIKAVIKRQKERAMACGTKMVKDPFLFSADPAGAQPWDPIRVTRRFNYLRKKADCPKVRLNDLRHYVATNLLGKGVDVITVAGRLGHDPVVTQRVYAEWIPENDRAAAKIMDDLLDGIEG
jgi:integrase